MDPFSAEGGKELPPFLLITLESDYLLELFTVHNEFYQGQYQNVMEFDDSPLSTENKIPAQVLQMRAQIANGQAEQVYARCQKESDVPDFAAVKALAQYSIGKTAVAIQEIESLAESSSENPTVQIIGGTLLQAEGRTDEALTLLANHQGSLEA